MSLVSKKTDSRDFDNISITAFRIISILNMLLKEPLSEDDLNRKLQENIEGSRNLSKDTICIYINTLRAIGCEISRPTKNNGYKYILKTHSFKLDLSQEEINSLVEVRKYISTLGDWKLAIEVDDLFNQILDIITPESKNAFLALKNIALCREIDIEKVLPTLDSLEKYCDKNRDILIVYNSPKSGEKEIYVKAEKLTLESGAFYLWGYNYELNETVYLRVDRIKSVNPVSINKIKKNNHRVEVKYKLTGAAALSFVPSDDEKVVEKTDSYTLVSAKVINKFKFIQDILSYGADCTIVSPENMKKEIILKLKAMAKTYQDTYLV